MVSILVQERILGAAMGAGFAAATVLYEQKLIYRSAARSFESISGRPVAPSAPQIPEPLFSKKTCAELAHAWNIAVDKSLGSMIAYLSSWMVTTDFFPSYGDILEHASSWLSDINM